MASWRLEEIILPLYLEDIDLSDNSLGSIPMNLSSLARLQKLKFVENMLQSVCAHTLPPNVKILDLRSNKTLVSLCCAQHLTKLESLYLNHTEIGRCFANVALPAALLSLNIADCSLRSITQQNLPPNLLYLTVCNNAELSLTNTTIGGHLVHATFKNCQLSTIDGVSCFPNL